MDLAETMKNVLAKGIQQTTVNDLPSSTSMGFPGTGYVTEKLYMLLQLYLQNKGWNPSVELLQCFTELKESSMLPSAAYLQMMASRVTLDSQGRLILRENGKIILPFEHFANAVMLKHMNGPHGLHLGVEATVRAVMESYTIGRENFGMEKEFIIEVVQNCPNPACRYYKNQMELTQKTLQHLTPGYLNDGQPNNPDMRSRLGAVDLTGQNNMDAKPNAPILDRPKSVAPTQQQITAALIQQQNRVIAQQNIEKLNANLEKQRHQIQLQQQMDIAKSQQKQHFDVSVMDPKLSDYIRANLENLEGLSAANKDLLALHNGAWTTANDEKRLSEGGQEKIVRAFAEVMKNLQRMKTYVRPAMCKPYGKQSEALQKTQTFDIQHQREQRFHRPRQTVNVDSEENDLDRLFPERTRHKTLHGGSSSTSTSSPDDNSETTPITPKTHIHSKLKNWYSSLCNRWLSLFGAALKIIIMFSVNWIYAICCISVVFLVWLYIGTANPAVKPGLASEFRFFRWFKSTLLHCFGKRYTDYEQIVVTPVHPGLDVTSAQLNEDNEDFANRRRYHQSATVHGHMVNVDD